MFYSISSTVSFRGWKNARYTLYDMKNKCIIKSLSKEEYDILVHLQGEKVGSSYSCSPEIVKIAIKYTIRGLLKQTEERLSLNENQKYIYYDCRHIKEAVWAITGKCNYKCRHCSVSAPNSNNEITFEDCKKIVNQLKECGIMNVTLIGGEPLLRRDFFDIVQLLVANEINISQIFTNGCLINENLLNSLEEMGVRPTFRLSFDGIGFHDIQRGINGAEKTLLSKLDLLASRDYETVIDMCMNYKNITVLEETVNMLYEKNVSMVNITPTCDVGMWKNVDNNEKLPFEMFYKYLLDFIPNFLKNDKKIHLNIYRIIYISHDKKIVKMIPKSFNGTIDGIEKICCPSFSNSINISSTGVLSPCFVILESGFIQDNMPNILDENLMEVLNGNKYSSVAFTSAKDIIKQNKECLKCEYRFLCGSGCRAIALCNSNNYFGSDDASCIFFRYGYHDKIKKIIEKVSK